ELRRDQNDAGVRRRQHRRVSRDAEERQVSPRRAVERRHTVDNCRRIADELTTDLLRNSRSGESETALTAAILVVGGGGNHCVGGLIGGRPVTPAGLAGAP